MTTGLPTGTEIVPVFVYWTCLNHGSYDSARETVDLLQVDLISHVKKVLHSERGERVKGITTQEKKNGGLTKSMETEQLFCRLICMISDNDDNSCFSTIKVKMMIKPRS